jgi:hypothetical protein
MIEQIFTSPNTIVASMTQNDFSNEGQTYKERFGMDSEGQFFNPEFVDWYMRHWENGYIFFNVRSSNTEFQHRVIVTLAKD